MILLLFFSTLLFIDMINTTGLKTSCFILKWQKHDRSIAMSNLEYYDHKFVSSYLHIEDLKFLID